jgi:hypothetical protein
MTRALKAAFLLRFPVRGLGDVPLNVIGVACFGLLGFGNAGFWFAGLGLETLYLASLATHPRFQRWAEVQGQSQQSFDVEAKRQALLEQLAPADQAAVQRLSARCRRIEALWEAHDYVVAQSNRQALHDLQWLYVKLQLVRQHVTGSDTEADQGKLSADIEGLERELSSASQSQASRQSKAATLDLLRQRARNFERRRRTLDEIGSDLARIEAQVALVLENTSLEGAPAAISADLDLASQLLDGTQFGVSASDVAALDAAYARPPVDVVQKQL